MEIEKRRKKKKRRKKLGEVEMIPRVTETLVPLRTKKATYIIVTTTWCSLAIPVKLDKTHKPT